MPYTGRDFSKIERLLIGLETWCRDQTHKCPSNFWRFSDITVYLHRMPWGYCLKLMIFFAGPGSHYCENVGRCHRSNHNFFVVNFLEGVFAQKCYDPDCSHFRWCSSLICAQSLTNESWLFPYLRHQLLQQRHKTSIEIHSWHPLALMCSDWIILMLHLTSKDP